MIKPAALAAALLSVSAFCLACSGASPDPDNAASSESRYTEADAGPDANAEAAVNVVDVPRYASASTTPQMRWSIDNAPVTEGIQAELKISGFAVDGSAQPKRRYQLVAATPILGGAPVVMIELGRGTEIIAAGDYNCASDEALVFVRQADNTRLMTGVQGAASRPCVVHVDSVVDASPPPPRPGSLLPTASMKRVTGHFEGIVGSRDDDASSPTREVHGAFAATMLESH